MPQPSRHTLSRGALWSTLAREISATTVYSENVLHPMKWKRLLPLQEKRLVPSGIKPLPWVSLENKTQSQFWQQISCAQWDFDLGSWSAQLHRCFLIPRLAWSFDTSWFWDSYRTCILHTGGCIRVWRCPLKVQMIIYACAFTLQASILPAKGKDDWKNLAETWWLPRRHSPRCQLPRGPALQGKLLQGRSHLVCRSQCDRFLWPRSERKDCDLIRALIWTEISAARNQSVHVSMCHN